MLRKVFFPRESGSPVTKSRAMCNRSLDVRFCLRDHTGPLEETEGPEGAQMAGDVRGVGPLEGFLAQSIGYIQASRQGVSWRRFQGVPLGDSVFLPPSEGYQDVVRWQDRRGVHPGVLRLVLSGEGISFGVLTP